MRYRITTPPSNAVTARVVLLAGLLLAVLLLSSPACSHPAYAQETIEYPENGEVPVAAYVAVDPDEDDEITWTLDGDRRRIDFTIEGGVLEFKRSARLRERRTMRATELEHVQRDGGGQRRREEEDTTDSQWSSVTNVDEDGVVTLSAVQPQEATPLTATHTDPDGVTANTIEWQWSRSSSANGPWTEIEFEEETPPSATYTPTDDDVGKYLRATASYDDGEDTGKTAHGVSDHPVERTPATKPPVFPDQDTDTDGDQSDTATREVAENTADGSARGRPRRGHGRQRRHTDLHAGRHSTLLRSPSTG